MNRRTFTDSKGARWEVYELVLPVAPRRPGAPIPAGTTDVQPRIEAWLCFESTTEKRRLRPIPEDWVDVPDASLERLLGRATVAPPSPT